jgi:diadenosine tetraphosphate (Ap4A) HIT family hydrolase
MAEKYENIIHERVAMANKGENKTTIIKMKSGWVVFGDNQIIPGYCLLLSDPVVESINVLDREKRTQFLVDMSIIGDVLLKTLNAQLINYSILGNLDRSLHAHIHPRYDSEREEYRNRPLFLYNFNKEQAIPFDYERDKKIMEIIRNEIEVIYGN